MNSIKAIKQLEDLKRDRLSFICNNELDKVFLEDIKAITLAIQALKKCPNITDNSFKCKMCGKELRTWRSIQKGYGPVCEREYLKNIYNNQQITTDFILKDKKRER